MSITGISFQKIEGKGICIRPADIRDTDTTACDQSNPQIWKLKKSSASFNPIERARERRYPCAFEADDYEAMHDMTSQSRRDSYQSYCFLPIGAMKRPRERCKSVEAHYISCKKRAKTHGMTDDVSVELFCDEQMEPSLVNLIQFVDKVKHLEYSTENIVKR